jgi:predicted RNase H-like HicB family nuclease
MKALSMTWMACAAALLGVHTKASTPQEINNNIKSQG